MKRLCPKCGQCRIHQSWAVLRVSCPECGCLLRAREADTWFVMYMSTAGLTGLFVVLMLAVSPGLPTLGRLFVGVGSLGLITFSIPWRKGLAIALNYIVDEKLEFPKYRAKT